MGYYNNEFLDEFMFSQETNPRYAGLARKALSYYLGDKYNPETFSGELECFFRSMIKGYVELKVFDGQPYDWPLIDNFFRKVLHDAGYPELNFDIATINKGYNGVMRGELPIYQA